VKKIACVVLPTYNEAANLRVLLPRILEQARAMPASELCVLVVDDDSPDGTAEVVRDFMRSDSRIHLLSGRKQGLGEAYKRGMAVALDELRADLIIQMDGDLQHDPSLLPRLIGLSDEGHEVVIASRFAPGGETPGLSWYRRALSCVANWLVRRLSGSPAISDCTSGYRAIQAEMLRRCDLRGLSTRGYSFQCSLLCELIGKGARVAEIPMIFGKRRYGRSKLSLRDEVEFLLNVVKLRCRRGAVRKG